LNTGFKGVPRKGSGIVNSLKTNGKGFKEGHLVEGQSWPCFTKRKKDKN